MINKEEVIKKIKKLNATFCTGMTCKKNIKRDSIIIAAVVMIIITIIGISKYNYSKETRRQEVLGEKADALIYNHAEGEFQEQSRIKINAIQDQISIDNWKDYETKWYGFKLKYPQEWKHSVVEKVGNSGAEYRYGFRKTDNVNDRYIGFDVAVYNIKKTKEFTNTGEFPSLKEGSVEEGNKCETIEGHLIETGDYIAEEIYIPLEDDCYNPVLFFSVTKGQYIYNMVPIAKEGVEIFGDPMVEIADNLPEFFAAISSFENIDIVRPKPKPSPIINAPNPVSYKKDSLGRKVCAKKNDKPSKSKQNKKKHLDMECCLDLDEYPNPHCYYSPKKYGKYLK